MIFALLAKKYIIFSPRSWLTNSPTAREDSSEDAMSNHIVRR